MFEGMIFFIPYHTVLQIWQKKDKIIDFLLLFRYKIMVLTNLYPFARAKHFVSLFFGRQKRKNCFLEVLPHQLSKVVWHPLAAMILKKKNQIGRWVKIGYTYLVYSPLEVDMSS